MWHLGNLQTPTFREHDDPPISANMPSLEGLG